MDVILKALLVSNKPEGVKRSFVTKIAKNGSDPKQTTDLQNMFTFCFETILNTDDELSYWACKQVYAEWVKYNSSSLDTFFTKDRLLHLMSGDFHNNHGAVWIIQETFKVFQKTNNSNFQHLCQIVEIRAIAYVREHSGFEAITAFCKLLNTFKMCIPKGDLTSSFCISVIHAVSAFAVPEGDANVHSFIKDVTLIIGAFLKHIWLNTDRDCIMQSLKAIFTVISYINPERGASEPCVAMGGLVCHIPVNMIEGVTKNTVSDNTIRDDMMKAALMRMIDWLNWPLAQNVEHWIIAFLQGLASVHKYTILIEVTENKVELVYERLYYPIVRDRAFAVLSHMLLSFQHSPEAFHKIIQDVPNYVSKFYNPKNEESRRFFEKFAELMHTLIHLHPGFPDLYDNVLTAIQGLPKPSPEKIKARLAQSKWTSNQKPGTSLLYRSHYGKKSETGKTGLINLGNTCFMNSVIQSLYMCDSFRQEAMKCIPSLPQQNILSQMQLLFAHLSISQRPAYSPSKFLEVSIPPWFTQGRQQDCSEYLKYLIDQLHEQEKTRVRHQAALAQSASPRGKSGTLPRSGPLHSNPDSEEPETLVQRTYGGKAVTTYRCLRCKYESSRTEMFTDLPLAFQDHEEPRVATRQSERNAQKSAAPSNGANSNSQNKQDQEKENGDSITLEEMLSYYLKPERLEGNNKYHCEKCGSLQDGERLHKIVETPEYLIITLLRFSFSARTQRRSKILTDVKYPRTLYVPVVGLGRGANSMKRSRPSRSPLSSMTTQERYGLCSVVVHSGLSSDCGHYYCYARHSVPVDPTENGNSQTRGTPDEDYLQSKWYNFNDNRVSYSSYESFSQVTKRFSKDTAYVLIYRKLHDTLLRGGTVDMNETIATALIDPPLRRDLRESVERDNKLFLQEQELEGRTRAMQQRNLSTSGWYNWRDDDSDGPPGSCGGGSGPGGMDLSGSRFVF